MGSRHNISRESRIFEWKGLLPSNLLPLGIPVMIKSFIRDL